MLKSRLGLTASNLFKINRPTCLFLQRNIKQDVKSDDQDVEDQPVTFSKSRAAQWRAEFNRIPPDNRVWFSPYVVSGSVIIFLIYFCILREENDIDEIIFRPLPETIKGLEKVYPQYDFYTKPNFVRYYEEKLKPKDQKSGS